MRRVRPLLAALSLVACAAPTPSARAPEPAETSAPVPGVPASASTSSAPMAAPTPSAVGSRTSTPTAPASASAPIAIASASASAKPAVPGNEIEIANGGDGATLGLSIHVEEIVTKIGVDGVEDLRVRLRLRAGAKTETVTLFSSESPTDWNGYTIECVDGWNRSVKLRVARVAKP
jgi:hypothetical protein